MFCLKCGNPIGEGEQFCSKCGTAVQPDSLQPDESNILVDSSTDNVENGNVSGSISTAEASDEPEKAAQSEVNDTDESAPRLHQEPIPAPALKSEPPAEPISAPPIYQAPPQPQYQQQPQYQPQHPQTPNQPNPIPVPAAAAPLPPPPPPFMKRKAYFKSAAPEKIKGKVDTLSGLTGMGLGAILVLIVPFIVLLLDTIHYNSTRFNSSYIVSELGNADTLLIVAIVALSVLAVFALLCIFAMKTKHFVFYIFLLLLPIALTAASVFGFILFTDTNSVKYTLSESNGYTAILLILAIAVSAIALVFSVISLVLSIIVSGSYKKAQQEYIWRAANGNRQ